MAADATETAIIADIEAVKNDVAQLISILTTTHAQLIAIQTSGTGTTGTSADDTAVKASILAGIQDVINGIAPTLRQFGVAIAPNPTPAPTPAPTPSTVSRIVMALIGNPPNAGGRFSISLSAVDSTGAPVPSYVGPVHLTGPGSVAGDLTLNSGTLTESLTAPTTSGPATYSVVDNANAAITGSITITIG